MGGRELDIRKQITVHDLGVNGLVSYKAPSDGRRVFAQVYHVNLKEGKVHIDTGSDGTHIFCESEFVAIDLKRVTPLDLISAANRLTFAKIALEKRLDEVKRTACRGVGTGPG